MGISKMGEGCPIQGRAADAAQGYVERTFPPDSDKNSYLCCGVLLLASPGSIRGGGRFALQFVK